MITKHSEKCRVVKRKVERTMAGGNGAVSLSMLRVLAWGELVHFEFARKMMRLKNVS